MVGHGESLRLENRVPGGDVNPYLALAAIIAAGLHGVNKGLALEDEFTGNAYAGRQAVGAPARCARPATCSSGKRDRPPGLRRRRGLRSLQPTWPHVELDAYDAVVTDWERFRGFERL